MFGARFASALVDRERCILELERTMYDHEVREMQLNAQHALERYDRACSETADAEAELVRVQAEGPANHRKKDHIDKVGCQLRLLMTHASCSSTAMPTSVRQEDLYSPFHTAEPIPCRSDGTVLGVPLRPLCSKRVDLLPAWEQVFWCSHADTALQATKEAEHREKLSDLKVRIDSCKERCDQENAAYQTAQVCTLLVPQHQDDRCGLK